MGKGEMPMKKQEELLRELTELTGATKEGKIAWTLEVQTTEGNEPSEKPVEQENGILWTVDECYVSFYCNYKGKEFCLITYEMIKTAEERQTTSNLVFCPPLGMRFFDLHTLMPYSVEASAVLLSQIHQLWELLTELRRQDPERVEMKVEERRLSIED